MFFWLIAGFMTGIAASFFCLRLWRGGWRSSRWLPVSLAAFLAVVVFVYAQVGRPPQFLQATSSDRAMRQGVPAAMRSMAQVTAQLQARLAQGVGNDADWQLLRQSYEFMGDSAAAAAASQRRLPEAAEASAETASSDGESAATGSTASYRPTVRAEANSAAAWRAAAEQARTARQFPQANAAYAELIKLNAMDADTWADYADSTASENGSLINDKTMVALEMALKLDSRHAKALWLKASLLLEQKRYAQSLDAWKQLRAVIGAASPDAKIIDANIAEAQTLASSQSTVAGANAPVSATAAVHGSVDVDAGLRSKFTGMTLFVFAKTPDSPAPVAVYRVQVSDWPVRFSLDDSLAMMPTRKLSNYAQVQVQARLSRSGQAVAQSGDWQSESATVKTRGAAGLALTIRQPVGKAGS